MLKVAPSLLSADFGRLREEVEALESAGADWLHFDVMDGDFVPNITMGPVVLEAVRSATGLPIDVHLMIRRPELLIDAFAAAGASRAIVHYEACTHLHRTLNQIHECGLAAGVAFNPSTPLQLERATLESVDQVLVMTVNPGFPAQRFIPGTLAKVQQAASVVRESGRAIDVQVDGGIDDETGPHCTGLGATVLVAGNYVFSHPSGYAAAIASLRAPGSIGSTSSGQGVIPDRR